MWVHHIFFSHGWLPRRCSAVQALSSSTSERLFPQAALVVASNRNRMSGDTSAGIIFFRHQSVKHNSFKMCALLLMQSVSSVVCHTSKYFCKHVVVGELIVYLIYIMRDTMR